MISLIIPSYNNLRHLKNAYDSIKKHAPAAEIILLDDGSTDGTWEWIQQQDCISYKSNKRVGHTVLYDRGIELATNHIVGILHADMIIGPNYIENMIKHLKPKTVVCATRIEPPLHPEGKEKIIKNFGMDYDSLDVERFYNYCTELQTTYKDITTKGMFAPWILYKEDYNFIGGHDDLFAPFPYEDSDIFQRWILAGYELIQSRDSFVYHLTCRGHRWSANIGIDDNYFKEAELKSRRNYIRKWGSCISNDELEYPIITPKYNIGFVVKYCNLELLSDLEPWCSTIYIEDDMSLISSHYIQTNQHLTKYNLSDRIRWISILSEPDNDIIVEIDKNTFTADDFKIITNLPQIIQNSGSIGKFTLGNLSINIRNLTELQNNLIFINN